MLLQNSGLNLPNTTGSTIRSKKKHQMDKIETLTKTTLHHLTSWPATSVKNTEKNIFLKIKVFHTPHLPSCLRCRMTSCRRLTWEGPCEMMLLKLITSAVRDLNLRSVLLRLCYKRKRGEKRGKPRWLAYICWLELFEGNLGLLRTPYFPKESWYSVAHEHTS